MSQDTYKILVETAVEERLASSGLASASDAFQSWANDIILEPYDLSVDEVDAGVTDGGGDGQIDSMYVIVNGVSLAEDADDIPLKGPIEIDILFAQTKYTSGFAENVIRIIRTSVLDLLNLEKNYSTPYLNYSESLQNRFAIARKALLSSAGREAKIRVNMYYATKGNINTIHTNVRAATNDLKNEISKLATTSDVSISFLGAAELIELSRKPKTYERKLLVEQSLTSDTGDSFACLVRLSDFVSFLTNEYGNINRSLFDANVRDFQGNTEVNNSIKQKLSNLNEDDFWWYNNGITLVSSFVDPKGKTLNLKDPLLINGLQTSSVIFSYFHEHGNSPQFDRLKNKIVFVKIVVPPSEAIRDEIIKATNSQTTIPKPYLRGMDNVHRNIEDHLKSIGIFYERRKNQYKVLGKSRSTIVTLSEAAQALMAAILFRGADARGRPNSLLKSDEDYRRLFSEKYHLNTFSNIILAKRRVMSRIPVLFPGESTNFRNNIVFHALSFVSAQAYDTSSQAAAEWANKNLADDETDIAICKVVEIFRREGGTDKIAKNRQFGEKVNLIARGL